MKRVIKKIFLQFSLGRKLVQMRRKKRSLAQFGARDPQELFTRYFETGEWDSEESASGPGSTVEYTENIRKEIPALINSLGVKKILDAPCGDYNWFQLVPRGEDVCYLGGDIVEPLVRRNQEAYQNENTRFMHIDIIKDPLPDSDLWLCRDCLFHLSNEDVFLAINNYLNCDIKYLLTSMHPECDVNTDIATGRFRLMNLELPPFSFPRPLKSIDDWIKGFPVRKLVLWERQQIADAVASNPEFVRVVKSLR